MSVERSSYRIVVVDDSAATREAVKHFLVGIDSADFEIYEAENGIEALKVLAGIDADLVLTDLAMPQMDGVQLIRQLRAQERFRHVPILLLTAHTEEQKRVEVFRCGATDYVVKPFSSAELAARLMGYLERKRAFETIQNSVDQARLTQAALLPQELPRVEGATVARRYVPAEHLSGDFYDFFALRDGRLGILIADASGHGISAALISFLIAGILKHFVQITDAPEEVLRQSSATVAGKIPEERYATACYAIYDPTDHSLTYSSAGHIPPLLLRGDQVKELTLEGTPLGMDRPGIAHYKSGSVELQSGDRVLFMTDGILEAVDEGGHPLGLRRLRRFLVDNASVQVESLLEAIVDFGRSHAAASSFDDDVTLVALQVL